MPFKPRSMVAIDCSVCCCKLAGSPEESCPMALEPQHLRPPSSRFLLCFPVFGSGRRLDRLVPALSCCKWVSRRCPISEGGNSTDASSTGSEGWMRRRELRGLRRLRPVKWQLKQPVSKNGSSHATLLSRRLHFPNPLSSSTFAGCRCRRPRSAAVSGIRSRNSVPRPCLDCTSMLPWCNCRMR